MTVSRSLAPKSKKEYEFTISNYFLVKDYEIISSRSSSRQMFKES